MPPITTASLQTALNIPDFDVTAAWRQMRLDPPIPRSKPPQDGSVRGAGVLVMVYPHAGQLTTLLMRRTTDPSVHSGQISFPGGKAESCDADIIATALREAEEEVGVRVDRASILGTLTDVYIPPSHFLVTPVVVVLPHRPTFVPSPVEVAALLEMPLSHLLDPDAVKTTPMTLHGHPFNVPYYDVYGQVVWGATALILSELEGRLRVVMV